MASEGPRWVWSEPHQDYYYATLDVEGAPIYYWGKQTPQIVDSERYASQSVQTHTTADGRPQIYRHSLPREDNSNYRYQNVGSSALSQHSMGPVVISGTIEKGWYEILDPIRSDEDDISLVKVGHDAQIAVRRFVIVDVKREGYCVACPIYTYGGRGTTKPGCRPEHHAVAYLSWTEPSQYQGESITKEPIRIQPADAETTMHQASRINFAQTFIIKWDVKVKDIGMVSLEDCEKLVDYYRDLNCSMEMSEIALASLVVEAAVCGAVCGALSMFK
ncbi:hypothetical protein K505DRAFT_363700 [Melanomma pulvis-pyrius CBS 109.77]|uniref:DUF6590 domain-containing protein n=1 Tax=Melanomma pulvis-pyrius CBS 109.77 TaxID=1314802 RepID=A0A6A6X622_9PLEO|nr:hypothetical protein K505DRAFT_363700 [Melanomma pulvis-pyrius CBS 109.77]